MAVTMVILAIVVLAGVFIIGNVFMSRTIDAEVEELFSDSKDVSHKTFNYEDISDLPEPVQHYFRNVLPAGQPYISHLRLKYEGKFKIDLKKKWIDIKGEQYFTADPPGFIWVGKTSLFTARDMYIGGNGRLVVKLLSLITVANAEGKKIDQAELLRWLGESVWFPTNLLPGDNLDWKPIDSDTVRLGFYYDNKKIYYDVTFNQEGEIVKMETERYMDENLERWIGKFYNYEETDGIIVPTEIEAIWNLEDGDYSYARFTVRDFEYNKPERY